MVKGKSSYVETLRTAVAIGLSLAIVCVIVFCISSSPVSALKDFLFGPLYSIRRMGNVIEASVPLMFTGLAVIMLQRAGLYNLAMEGAFFIGSVAATAAALLLNISPVLTLIIACGAGALAGGIVCAIPTVLKVKCESNVLVTSLMLNYICLYLGLYIIINFFQDPKMNSNYSYLLGEGVAFGKLFSKTRINSGLIVCAICIFLVWLLLNKTSFGYKVTMVGKNEVMAKYSGMNIGKMIIGSSVIGGLLAGLGGAVDLFGMYERFQYAGLTGYGWDGILIAIVARHKAQYVPFAALFLAYLRTGADVMSINSDIPSEMIKIIQAIVIVLISAQAILSKYKRKLIIQEANEAEKEVA
ncbi:ABC-type uncharacterized transport system permease subunit [Lachnospiraceae bacterium PM6-15]|uniref:ABC transporter permease n=1 Tax=Ohessyouella blattaphilus TaxID=2949333 RepID=UPI003E2D02EE